jgi:hypothetical protein
MTVLRFTQMKKPLGFTTIAALLVSTGAASAALIQVPCRGAVGEDQPTEFTIAIDLALSVITEGDFRWTTTDDDATIDWNLHRQTGALRGVVLTGADAGVLIVGECNQSAERNFDCSNGCTKYPGVTAGERPERWTLAGQSGRGVRQPKAVTLRTHNKHLLRLIMKCFRSRFVALHHIRRR